LQVQKHEIEFLLPEAMNGLFSRSDHDSAEADLLQKCSKKILQTQSSSTTNCAALGALRMWDRKIVDVADITWIVTAIVTRFLGKMAVVSDARRL
jgi:hypothetical protein